MTSNGSAPRDATFRYQWVADKLRQEINDGTHRPGERLPTQEELAERYQVSRATVIQALDVLRESGLIVTRQGSGTFVTSEPDVLTRPAEGDAIGEHVFANVVPQQTAAALGPRIMGAFEAPHVRIDAICLTAESLNQALAEPLRLVRAGRITPESVKVRLLVPSRNLDLAFPRPTEEESGDGQRVHEHWLSLRNSHGRVLRSSLRALRSTRGIDVEVTLKTLPFTPPVKLYLLNGSESLFAYYTVTKREEQIDEMATEIYDALGSDSVLFPFEVGGGTKEEAFVAQSQAWFDGLWGTIAMQIILGG
ncbi:GntR family transcriptional regulator [Streptomyces sp. NPDC020681]|uniref:GntR family transcriptional regulator n=1 Tax=Streptomyces sp. NPDC020681 TaxID=3365083 RepID=UPI0037B58636